MNRLVNSFKNHIGVEQKPTEKADLKFYENLEG